MREILFKAKRKDNGDWIQGTGITDFLNIEPDSKDKMWLWCDYAYPDGLGKGWVEIDPETLCQYTGIDDCKGNKIFEGDIIDMRLNGVYPVKWDETQTGFVCNVWCGSEFSKYKIIGNIHDND